MSECVLSGHGNDDNGQPRRREAEVGLLCLWHRGRLTSTNNEIRELWFDLSLIVEAGSAPKDETPKTRHLKSAEAPAPANLDVLALRDPRSHPVQIPPTPANVYGDPSNPVPPVLTVVASWLCLVWEERPLTETRHRQGPLVVMKNRAEWTDIAYTAPMTLPKSVIAQLALLTRHHDWISAQLWVDDYAGEMRALQKALRAAVRDQTHREVGRCRLPTETKEACGGVLVEENGSGIIRCRDCRAAWVTAQEQARLAITLESA